MRNTFLIGPPSKARLAVSRNRSRARTRVGSLRETGYCFADEAFLTEHAINLHGVNVLGFGEQRSLDDLKATGAGGPDTRVGSRVARPHCAVATEAYASSGPPTLTSGKGLRF
jgi:hypothetical protein